MNKGFGFLAFALGAAVGSLVTWKLMENKVRDKYEKISREEIDNIKERYTILKPEYETEQQEAEKIEEVSGDPWGSDKDHENEAVKTDNKTIEPDEDSEYMGYATIINKNKYVSSEEGVHDVYKFKPYIIPPEEFGEEFNYDCETLYYYADGVVTDDQDVPIENIRNVVGLEFPNHYGEYEEDCVYVRNDELKTDYEILMDVRPFSEAFDDTDSEA